MADQGQQIITFDYKNPATGESFNKLLKDIVPAGIYRGEKNCEVNGSGNPVVNPMTLIVYDEVTDIAVRVQITSPAPIDIQPVDTNKTHLIARYDWADFEDTYMEIMPVTAAEYNSNDDYILIAEMSFDGSGNLTGFNYDNADINTNRADTLPLGATITQTVAGGGTSYAFSESDYVTDVLNTLVSRIVDLSGVSDDAVKKRHIDFGNGSNQINAQDIYVGQTLTGGGPAGNYNATTQTITNTLQELMTRMTNLAGTNDSSVTLDKLAIGQGANQLNASKLPLAANVSKTITGHSNINVSKGSALSSVFSQMATTLKELSETIKQQDTSISNIASDISTLETKYENMDAYPVGYMFFYDGKDNDGNLDWVDNSTIPGWYACTGSNNTPDLSDLFIKGTASPAANYSDNVDGSDHITLSENNMPKHSHSVSGTFSGQTDSAGEHDHSYKDTYHSEHVSHAPNVDNIRSNPQDIGSNGGTDNDNVGFYVERRTTSAGEHEHNIEGTFTGSTGSAGSGTSIHINPRHYKAIIVRKMS